jgi:hypothetical protein
VLFECATFGGSADVSLAKLYIFNLPHLIQILVHYPVVGKVTVTHLPSYITSHFLE